ncbi:MAG TPA: FMN-binding protein, partial [Feifaniaceae bacterium]|nr:FMN-binding protein [Feifaniaceae bacterium]
MREFIHLGGRLFLIALIAGLALGATYYVTKEPIEAQTRIAAEAARVEVFEGTFTQDTQETLPEPIKTLYRAKGERDGYVMEVEASGYGGIFTVTVGMTADGEITGIVVGDNSETPGLGKNAQKPEFAAQFAGKDGE